MRCAGVTARTRGITGISRISYNANGMASPAIPPSEVEAHLERVLASATFKGAERSARLLRYIVSETLQGRGRALKDYTLGAEALGRGEAFDPRTDPIARVEASRLRSRLELYYATEGGQDSVRIQVPKGGYVAVFEARPVAQNEGAVAGAQPERSAIDTSAPPVATARPWSRVWVPLSAALLASAATWWITRPLPVTSSSPMTRLELTTPATTDPASLAVSPDGRTVVFSAKDGEVSRLWMRELGEAAARPLAGTEDATLPFWSPDGRTIGFFTGGRVDSLELHTGIVRQVSVALVPAGGAWSPSGVVLHPLVPDSPLFRTTAGAGGLTPATTLALGQTGHRGPVILPGGERFLFYAAGAPDVRGVHLGTLGSLDATRVTDADAPAVFVAPATLMYVQRGRLFARRFDPATGVLSGDPVTLADDVSTDPNAGVAALAASATGTVAYRTGPIGTRRQLLWVDRQGAVTSRVGTPEERGPAYGSVAPDGRRLAVQRAVEGNTDIWIVDLERGPAVRLTTAPQADIAPVWSPRGDEIAYASQVDGVFELFATAPDHLAPRLLLRTGAAKQITDWSRDGRLLLYRALTPSPNGSADIFAVASDGDQAPVAVAKTTFDERNATFSPDGRWVAYQSNESGQHEVYVQPYMPSGERLRISAAGGVQPHWRGDGGELFYLALDGTLMAAPISTRAPGVLQPGTPVPLFQTHVGGVQGTALNSYAPAADGQRFLVDALVEQTPAPIALIVNWRAK